jgi:hypothetical protein
MHLEIFEFFREYIRQPFCWASLIMAAAMMITSWEELKRLRKNPQEYNVLHYEKTGAIMDSFTVSAKVRVKIQSTQLLLLVSALLVPLAAIMYRDLTILG